MVLLLTGVDVAQEGMKVTFVFSAYVHVQLPLVSYCISVDCELILDWVAFDKTAMF